MASDTQDPRDLGHADPVADASVPAPQPHVRAAVETMATGATGPESAGPWGELAIEIILLPNLEELPSLTGDQS